MSKITEYAALTDVQADDVLVVVDVHDTRQSTAGTTKKMTISQLPSGGGAVASVNGQTGAVELGASDVGALPRTGGTMSGPIEMGSSKITGLADGAAADDAAAYGQIPADWVNAAALFGADPAGASDATEAIQNALTAAAGRVVYLPAGTYALSSPLSIPASTALTGGAGIKHIGSSAILKLSPSFSGGKAIGFPAGSSEQTIANLVIDGSAAPAGSVIGISAASGEAQYVKLSGLLITGAGISNGVSAASSGSALANGWLCRDVVVLNVGSTGILLTGAGDHNWINCQSIGSGSYGWSLSGVGNSKFTACRADWSGNAGWFIQGSWSSGAGAGGIQLTGCSTDRNAQDGVLISGTGTSPILISGLMCRRDGSSSTSAGYAALRAGAAMTLPVIVDGMTCYPGTADDGTGNDSPQYGISMVSTGGYLCVTNAYLHAVSAGISPSGAISRSRAITTRTGSTSAPGTITPAADIS